MEGSGTRTVLVVDDEVDILELIELTLLRMGLDVERATGVKEADRAACQSSHYDLCLTDMRLPDGTGLEIVEHIASISDLPVAVITAHGNTENAVAALKAGAFDYVAKPVSLDQLRTLVKSALSLPQGPRRKSARSRREALLGDSHRHPAGAHADRKARRAARRPCTSPESRAAARNWRPGSSTEERAARRPLRTGQLRRDPREPDGERVLRLP